MILLGDVSPVRGRCFYAAYVHLEVRVSEKERKPSRYPELNHVGPVCWLL